LLQLQAMIAIENNDFVRARDILAHSVELFARCSNSSDRAHALRLLAETQMGLGESEEAIHHLRNVRELAASCGAVGEVNRCEALLRSLGIRPRAGRPRRATTSATSPALSPRE